MRAAEWREDPAARGGFSLIEIVVVLALMSLLAGALAPMAVRQMSAQRRETTIEKMRRLEVSLVGDPRRDDHGYLGDMGALPATLADLNARGAQPAYAIDGNDGIGAGWNGPYADELRPGSSPFVDAWGTAFQYSPGVAQLVSAGPDRAAGSADDLVHPAAAPATTGNLTVSVTGVPNDGGPSCLLGSSEVDVYVSSSVAGARSETLMGGGGPFTAAPLHNGYHGVRAAGLGSWSGAAARDVAVVRGANALLRLSLLQPGGAPPGCSGGGP